MGLCTPVFETVMVVVILIFGSGLGMGYMCKHIMECEKRSTINTADPTITVELSVQAFGLVPHFTAATRKQIGTPKYTSIPNA